jgi:TctA family transporter
LGIILGPVIERGLTTGLVLMDYSVLAFVSRPITAVLLVMAVAFAASPIVRDILKKMRVTVKEKN